MKLWLLRHAQVTLESGLCYGSTDVPADPALNQQAAGSAAALLPRGVPVRVSGLGRAQQLARELCRLRPDLQPPAIDSRLNEMNFGRWELQRWDAIPRADFEAWMTDFAHHRFGGGESTQEVLDRVTDALVEQQALGLPDAVWVTHAGVIRAVRYLSEHGRCTIREAAQWPREAPAPGGVEVLDFGGQ
ncbi:histidine phosphatase family protein [Ideonella sp.]|jgi:alpha-ribazole phosphatase|uniref:histidine phosphatase family protein n=1 Tax=Ideonella sp. TaxID=1929293 RepID=UPI0037C09D30